MFSGPNDNHITTIVTVEEMAVDAMALDVMARRPNKLLCFVVIKTFLSSENVLLEVQYIGFFKRHLHERYCSQNA
jgi:hypothetical protein